MLKVNEIFKSIQGESTYAGLPCIFIRLTGCNLRCNYCDTVYAYENGVEMRIEEILSDIELLGGSLIEITGGEPLLQGETGELVSLLIKRGCRVLVETNGTLDINALPEGTIRIMDLKCPDSGMADKTDWKNVERLRPNDEVKFVLSSRRDYEWAKDVIGKYRLTKKVKVLIGVAFNKLDLERVASWILEDGIDVRLQLQIHRYIWPPDTPEGIILRSTCRYESGSGSSTPKRRDG
ncbi:MAG: 7-carboxy-7-deazaguanine synthase [Planctomycetes bacterium RIFCSPLOWO2_02_FULL_50_16]|nr:MAG: 7-carboxy-7-deazaguanine synthase [Planctomycetes bacterium RIFCSPLOWO2_02_FULL_50_16]